MMGSKTIPVWPLRVKVSNPDAPHFWAADAADER